MVPSRVRSVQLAWRVRRFLQETQLRQREPLEQVLLRPGPDLPQLLRVTRKLVLPEFPFLLLVLSDEHKNSGSRRKQRKERRF